MKKFYSLICVLLIFAVKVQGNEIILSRQLTWKETVKIKQDNGKEIQLQTFNGAQIDNETSLPVFQERMLLGNAKHNFKVKISNAIYEQVSAASFEAIEDALRITSDIKIETHISISRKNYYGNISFIPVRKNEITGVYERLISFDLVIEQSHSTALTSEKNNKTYSTSSILSTGDWYKIAIQKEGVYKLSYSDLKSMGMDMVTVNPADIRVYGNGGGMLPFLNSSFRYDDLQENAIYVDDGGDNTFDDGDYILFYAKSPNVWKYSTSDNHYHHTHHLFSDSAYYFITADLGVGKRIQAIPSAGSAIFSITTYDDYAYHEKEDINFIESGRLWYGELFDDVTQYLIDEFNFSNIDITAPAYVKVQLAAASTSSSNFTVDVAGIATSTVTVAAITGEQYKDLAYISTKTIDFIPVSPSIPITITYNKSTATSIGWLDFIEINVKRNLVYENGEQLLFRNVHETEAGQIVEVQITDSTVGIHHIWNVTDPFNVTEMSVNYLDNTSSFTVQADSLLEFVAFDTSSVMAPSLLGYVPNQNIHALGIDANGNIEKVDMIIVTHPDFLEEAGRLAQVHEQRDSMLVAVVTTSQVYNEFSSGAQDVCAIRDFMKMLYDRADSSAMPSYLLLFGDGSYDPKDRLSGNTNFVITFQNDNAFNEIKSYVSDDFFVLLDDSEGEWDYGDKGDLDMGIGRFPVKTIEEAKVAVDKVIQYYDASTMGDWRNMICFIADDEDNNIHLQQADNLAKYVKNNYSRFNIDKIYLDAYEQTSDATGPHYIDATIAINNRVNKGALIVNYTGHGGVNGLAHERVIEDPEINKWDNIGNMPIFMTATCEVSRFDDPELISAGEHIFLNENGGGIALFSTVRAVYSSYNDLLNQDFYKTVFEKENDEYMLLGEIFRLTKNRSGVNDNSKNFTLLGDPALKLAIPEYNINTFTINDNDVTVVTDTIEALSKVTIAGFIGDSASSIISTYNGTLYPTVFDKAKTIWTMANDNVSFKQTFELQNSILFKGKASVVDGLFSFSFVVPKDIALQYGSGKISYYVENVEKDGSGYCNNFIIGGINANATSDVKGPEVELYMNDESFEFGQITDNSPLMLAFITDSNGVNTVGNGIGHDILVTLDNNTADAIVLNDYYEADLNSYQSGSIQYPFNELSTGRHSLELTVWDVYDNSSKSYTEFIVAETANIALKHVLNYPNPFTTHTEFLFEHNQPGIPIIVQIQIYTVSGRLIKTLNTTMQTDNYRSDAIVWNGEDDYNNVIGKGVYIYKLSAQVASGKAEQIEKLVILR